MWSYTARRLLGLIPVLVGISLLVFMLLHLIPGDPATVLLGERGTVEQIAALKERMGLNKPLLEQYFIFVGQLLRGDLGSSTFSLIPVSEELARRWPATFELALAAMFIAITVGIPSGILAAVRKNTRLDNISSIISLLGVSVPVFYLGLLLMYLFAVNLHWLPPSTRVSSNSFQSITRVNT
ncbi:MAG: ABC transporter permease, partial [Deinococcus sp.]|nr:ABC transporter permease [Deinococcus sp.]